MGTIAMSREILIGLCLAVEMITLFSHNVQAQSCVDRNTPAADGMGLQVPWAPTVAQKLNFQVKNSGSARITVMGDTRPKITAFVGINAGSSGRNAVKEACACEGATLSISCPAGNIEVVSALFGRRVVGSVYCLFGSDASHTANNLNAACNTPGAMDFTLVDGMCTGNPSCVVTVSGTFPEPCGGIYKYLRVTYTCDMDDTSIDPTGFSTVPGNDAVISVEEINDYKEATSYGVVGLSSSQYTDLYLMIDNSGFHIGYDGQLPFISIESDQDLTSVTSVLFEGLGEECSCEDGAACTTDVIASDWRICDYLLQSIATGKSTDQSTCDTSTCGDLAVDGNTDNDHTTIPFCYLSDSFDTKPWWRVDLGDEYHVFGVEIIKQMDGNTEGRVETYAIRVGSCSETTDYTSNTQCGIPVTAAEAAEAVDVEPIFRACPTDTYGHFVYISNSNNNQLRFCEVMVYGQLASNPTELNFVQSSPTVMESAGSLTLNVARTNGGNHPTCTYFDIGSDSDCSGITTTADPSSPSGDIWLDPSNSPYTGIKLGPSATTTQVTLLVNNDETVEDTEYLGLCLDSISGANGGSLSSVRVAVTDEDTHHYLPTDIQYSVGESTGTTIPITIRRSGNTDKQSYVSISTNPLTGIINSGTSDFVGLNGKTVYFNAGDDEETVDITIQDDKVYEGDEMFTVQITSASTGEFDPTPVPVTIKDNDPEIGFSLITYEQSESGPLASVQIVKTYYDREVLFQLKSESSGTTATAGIDYNVVNRELIFPDGETILTIDDIPIDDDEESEGDETFRLVLTTTDASLKTGKDTTTVTIRDNDSIYSAESTFLSILESAGSIDVNFAREEGDLVEQTIDVLVSGSADSSSFLATNEVDFLKSGTNKVTFLSGSVNAKLTIPIVDDRYVEYNEEFYVDIITVNGEINGGRKRVTISIKNDDALYSLQLAEYNIFESSGSLFQVIITRGPSGDIPAYLDKEVSIYLSTVTSGETTDDDFQSVSNQEIIFRHGDSVKPGRITIYDNEIPENEESFSVIISNSNLAIDPNGGSSLVNIKDDDGFISLSLEDSEKIVSEDKGSVTFTVMRKGFLNDDGEDQSLKRVATAIVTALGDSASPGVDFQVFSTTVTFGIGEASVTDTINIKDDDVSESTETFRIVLTDADGEIDEGNDEVTVTIIDNDEETFEFENTAYTTGESCGQLRVSIVRTGSSGQGTTLRLSATNGEAMYPSDYSPSDATVSFIGNQNTQSVIFDIELDGADEGPETFTMSLSKLSGSGEISSTRGVAVVTIQDQAGVFSFENNRIDVSESIGTLRLPLVRTGDPCAAANILVSTQDVEAKANRDYTSFTGRQVSFATGSSSTFVDVNIVNDNTYEDDESFIVKITSSDIPVGTAEVEVNIQDNDSEFKFRSDEYSVSESAGSVTITVDREGKTNEAAVARVEIIPNKGNAIAIRDFNYFSTMLVNFDPSDNSKSFAISIHNDDISEPDETFYVMIASVTDGIVTIPGETAVVIIDDDGPVEGGNGLSSTAIIAIASAGGGALLLLTVIGIIVCLVAMSNSARAARVPSNIALQQRYTAPYSYGQRQSPYTY